MKGLNLADPVILKKALRPMMAKLLIEFSIFYIAIIEIVFPLINVIDGLTGASALPHTANGAVLAATLTQPVLYVLARSYEKGEGKADVQSP